MENLFNPNIQFTDPDTLQFCVPLSKTEFWYAEPNLSHDVFLDPEYTIQQCIYDLYKGSPEKLLKDPKTDPDILEFITCTSYWCTATIDIEEIEQTEIEELLETYDCKWDDFRTETDRNQIICEYYFETNAFEFTNY